VREPDGLAEDEDAAVAAWGDSEARKGALNMVRGAKLVGAWGDPTTLDAVLQHVALVCFHAGLACTDAAELEALEKKL